MRDKVISLARKSGGLFIASAVSLMFSFLFVFFLARLLGAELYGYIPLARSSQLILEAFLEFGLASALIKRLSSQDDQVKIIGTSLSLKTIAGGASTLALIAMSLAAPPPMNIYLLAMSPFPLFAFLLTNARSVYSSKMELLKVSILAVLPDFLRFCIAILLFYLGFGVLSGILGYVGGAAIALALALAFLHRDKLLHFSFDLEEAKRQLFLGLFLNSTQLSSYFFPSFVTILSAFLLSISDVSVIAVSMSFASTIYIFLSPITAFLYPFTCEHYSNPKFNEFLKFLVRYWAAFLLLSLLAVQFGAGFVFGLLGKSFLIGSSVFLVIAAAVFLDSFKQISDYYFIARNKQKYIMLFEGVKFLLFFLSLIYIFYSHSAFGIESISWAILTSYAGAFALRLVFLYKNCPLELLLIPKAAILFGIFFYFGFQASGFTGKLLLFFAGTVLVLFFGLIKISDFKYLKEIAENKTSGG